VLKTSKKPIFLAFLRVKSKKTSEIAKIFFLETEKWHSQSTIENLKFQKTTIGRQHRKKL
jgi:hypothetical protein